MREPLGWPDVEVRPTPYRDNEGEIDLAAYWRPGPMIFVDIVLGLLLWALVGAVVWGVFLVTP